MKKVWILAACMTLLLLLGGCRKGQEMETIEEGVYEIYYLNTAGTRLVPMKYQPAAGEEDKGALIEELMQQNIDQLNTEMPAYSKVSCFKLYQEEFEKTPKRSIKRYLYQPAEEN